MTGDRATAENTQTIKVNLVGAGVLNVRKGISVLDLVQYDEYQRKSPIVAVMVDNALYGLLWELEQDCTVEFIDMESSDGMRVYTRSMVMLLARAASEVLPGCKLRMEHTLGNGVYGEIDYVRPLRKTDVDNIEKRMHEIVKADEPIIVHNVQREDVENLFKKSGQTEKLNLMRYRKNPGVYVHTCGWFNDFTYGNMVPSTGYLGIFRLRYYMPGFILELPRKENPQVVPIYVEQGKLANIYYESVKWSKILGVSNLIDLNDLVEKGKAGDLIRVAEAFQEKKISEIADQIARNIDLIRVVLIAGPSSSGKTTFAQRLGVQLRIHGIKPVPVSMDDYFVDREKTPRDEKGEYDFECLEAIDSELFNEHIISLIQGEEIELPSYDFITGSRQKSNKTLKLGDRDLLIIEGIHGLNDKLTSSIPKGRKFKIYVSALTQINLDNHNWVPTTYLRILRRIVRDYNSRGNNATDTIRRWPSVRRGEEKHIFPFQESADIMFNSALIYEIAVLKGYAEPLLKEVSRDNPEYAMARRLRRFLGYFVPISCEDIPYNSIIREFIGDSCFAVK
ncbi:uridine kinase [Desulfotomaculum arcticum]|uniref:Uridine kinase n=1 Tax=Desulfotruncus arcticus DSM 17038 TaxID=1121424 RepID=A0A1I2TLF5_9FIRM|nr:nucleoside kinase [Desulfotruncus arcticus]SFG65752.1 uridine kinase [Desulfotomaculum arcticum] [Desulfotruncus arcticus DSM 17038]